MDIIPPDKIGDLEAAGVGAIVSMLFQGKMGAWQVLTILISGEAGALYFTAPLAHMISPNDDGWRGGVGFMIGLLAMYIAGTLIDLGQKLRADPWATLARLPILGRYFGKGT